MLHLKVGDLLLGGLMISQSIEKSKSYTQIFTKKITPLVSDVYRMYILSPRWRCFLMMLLTEQKKKCTVSGLLLF